MVERLGRAGLGEYLVKRAREALAHSEIGLVMPLANEIIERERLVLGPESNEYSRFCHFLLRANVEIEERMLERAKGIFDGQATDPLISPPSPRTEPEVALPGETIMELYERYARDQSERIKADTIDQNRKIVRLFAEFVGLRTSASSINRKAIRDWKEQLFHWPVKAAEISEFAGMDFRKVIERNRSAGRKTISTKTLNKYLSALGSYCRWLDSHGYITENPTMNMQVALDKSAKKVLPYSTEQLEAIFSSPIYTGCAADKREHLPGDHVIRDHRYWLPLMALFTGARLGELCQLLIKDIAEQDGVWTISINADEDEHKSLKTRNAARVVPVHPELVSLGLLDRRAELEQAGEKRLFPEIKPDAHGHLSGFPSRWYGRFMKRIGVKHDKTVNFHSYRHGFIDALRRAGYQKHEFQPLIGHGGSTVTDRYGMLSEVVLEKRVEMVSKVRYPGLDLSGLYI